MPSASAPLLRFPTPYLRLLDEQVQRCGGDGHAWRARHGLDEAAWAGAWIDLPPARIVAVVTDALRESGEPALGLIMGERLAANAHGVVGHAVMHSKTLRQALEMVVRYAALRMPLLRVEAHEDARHGHLHLHPAYPCGEATRALLEATLLSLHRLLGALLLGPSPVDAVSVPHRLGADRNLARALFGLAVNENEVCASLRLPVAWLDRPLPLADPEAFAVAERQCREELARRDHAGTLAERLRALLAGPLLATADASVCARLLAMSPRSLERRLAREGSRFRDVVDALRCERAQALLRGGDGVEAAAAALGYSDTANFRRAFRRWTGQTPATWRASQTAG
jgi:AraC-like DNA-binding protein